MKLLNFLSLEQKEFHDNDRHCSILIVYIWTSYLGIIPDKSEGYKLEGYHTRLEVDFRAKLETEDTLKYLQYKAGSNL